MMAKRYVRSACALLVCVITIDPFELGTIGRDPAHAIEEIRVERGRLDEVFRQVTGARTSASARAAA